MHYLEAELKRRVRGSDELFDFLHEGATDGLWFWDLEQPEHEWMSPGFWRLLGCDPARKEHLAKEWIDLVHPDDLRLAVHNFRLHCEDPSRPYDQVVRYTHQDGSTVWVRCRGIAIRDEEGRAIRMLGVHSDMTQVMRAHEQVRALISANADGMLVLDEAGKIRFANPAAEEALGQPAFSLIGEPLPFERGEDQRVELVGPEGAPRALDLRENALTWRGRPATLLTLRDVSDQLLLEARLRKAERLEALGTLSGGIAHDFNNMLTVIIGNTEILLDELAPGSKQRERAQVLLLAGQRSAELTKRLLAFGRRQSLRPRAVDVGEVLAECQSLCKTLLGEDVETQLELSGEPLSARIDASELQHALVNLASNANHAMPRGGRLLLQARPSRPEEAAELGGDYVVVEVSDTGVGMAPEVRERVFEPFFTTRAAGVGTGLGLSSVHGFVKQSGGHIGCESEEGQGTTIRLYLPAYTAASSAAPAPAQQVSPGPGRERILVVEDDENLREFLRESLARAGYRVTSACDGQEALELEQREPGGFDALVTDLAMPRLGGEELASKLREVRPSLPCLFTSGHAAEDAQAGSSDCFLQKPFRGGELRRQLRELLDRAEARLSQVA
ncbi:MAG TPA: hypothetical protein DEA08_17195 [Planctomycetes bacterium]|nr:hypothetical protein [Planctomycetota bacterium]